MFALMVDTYVERLLISIQFQLNLKGIKGTDIQELILQSLHANQKSLKLNYVDFQSDLSGMVDRMRADIEIFKSQFATATIQIWVKLSLEKKQQLEKFVAYVDRIDEENFADF